MSTILIGFSDSDAIEALRQYLTNDGHTVVPTGNGKDLLKALDSHGIELIILDLDLPEDNEFEILEFISRTSKTNQLPIIVIARAGSANSVSGLSAHLKIVSAKALGAQIGLYEPVTKTELIDAVRALLA